MSGATRQLQQALLRRVPPTPCHKGKRRRQQSERYLREEEEDWQQRKRSRTSPQSWRGDGDSTTAPPGQFSTGANVDPPPVLTWVRTRVWYKQHFEQDSQAPADLWPKQIDHHQQTSLPLTKSVLINESEISLPIFNDSEDRSRSLNQPEMRSTESSRESQPYEDNNAFDPASDDARSVSTGDEDMEDFDSSVTATSLTSCTTLLDSEEHGDPEGHSTIPAGSAHLLMAA